MTQEEKTEIQSTDKRASRRLRFSRNWTGGERSYMDDEYRRAFIERVKEAREVAGFSQDEMAALLGIEKDTYRRYEGPRHNQPPTIMPQSLITKFCIACHISERWLLSGQADGAPKSIHAPPRKRSRGASSA